MDAERRVERAARALREIELSALAHHAHEGKMTLLHALQVEIPKMAEDARAALAAPEPAPKQAGEAMAWVASGRYGGADVEEYGGSLDDARERYRKAYGGFPIETAPLYAAPSRPGGA